ncbi:50S ribosomal protein L7ae [Candidatus Woesearchaeota archaeon]|nr:50S ribosomal protein L7ae [Candidatus Woesearchaeota archaeon]
MSEQAFEIIELARKTGKIKKGCNEVTKVLEKGQAKFVAYAEDTQPKEIVMHLPLLSKEKGVKCIAVSKKDELGAAAGLPLGTAAVAVVEEGNAKDLIKNV